jgi:hypothetical protein
MTFILANLTCLSSEVSYYIPNPYHPFSSSSNMTGRGIRGNPPLRPPSPTDPTLESRPVPRKRRFPIRSFGPGTAADIQQTCLPLKEIDRAFDESSIPPNDLDAGAHRVLLQRATKWEKTSFREDGRPAESDPTWGYYLFLTDYQTQAVDKVPRAVENLVRVQQRKLCADTAAANPYAKELYRRLRFNVVEDQEALEGASVDRVRECFRALVRSFELSDDEERYPPPARNMVCLVLDGAAVEMLANLEFYEDRRQESKAHRQYKLQAVDIHWRRPDMTRDSYRGARLLEISSLPDVYNSLDSETLDEVEQ